MRAANEVLFWSGSGRASCRVIEVAARFAITALDLAPLTSGSES